MMRSPSFVNQRFNRRTLLAGAAAGSALAAVPALERASAQTEVELRVLIQPGWGPTEEPLQLTGEQSTLYTELMPQYRETYPDVDLQVEAALGGTEGRTKYLLECRQGVQADVQQLDGFWISEFAALGCTRPLAGLLPDALVEDYFEPFVVRYHDEIVGLIPGTAFNSMLWYRKDLLEEAGFDGPPQDWDELKAYAEALTVDGRFGLAFPAEPTETTSVVNLGFYWQEQDVFVSPDNRPAFNNETSIEVFNLLAEIFQAGWAPRDSINLGYEGVQQLFFGDQAAMILHGSFIAPSVRLQDFADQVGLAPNPVSPRTGNRGTNAGGWGISIMTTLS